MSERFSLTWNDYQSNWRKSLAELRNDNNFSDITLISADKVKFSAHKILLSSCSKMIKFILDDTKQANLLFLGGVSSTNLGFILDYIYHGEVKIFQEHLDGFLASAQKLEILGLLSDIQNQEAFTRQSSMTMDEHFMKRDMISPKKEIVNNQPQPDPDDIKKSLQFCIEEHSLLDVNDSLPSQVERQNSRSTVMDANRYNVEAMNPMEIDAKVKSMYQKIDERWICLECSKTTNNMSNMKKHVEIHLEGLKYSCSSCSKDFRSKNLLYLHTKTKEHQYLKNFSG